MIRKQAAYFADVKITGSGLNAKQTRLSVAGSETLCLYTPATSAVYNTTTAPILQKLVHRLDQLHIWFGSSTLMP